MRVCQPDLREGAVPSAEIAGRGGLRRLGSMGRTAEHWSGKTVCAFDGLVW